MTKKRLPLPKQITVFSKTYRIVYCRKLENVDSYNKNKEKKKKAVFGSVDFEKMEIRLFRGKGFPFSEVWRYLIHEWNHIIEREMNIDFKKMTDEQIIDGFAVGTLHILVENNIYIKGTLKKNDS
ncbi:MAG TPA: hypothetical protein P5136_02725 [Methanofastidiosum sp.]|nr:hypothetical protein [Methanofastidiosum sp.]